MGEQKNNGGRAGEKKKEGTTKKIFEYILHGTHWTIHSMWIASFSVHKSPKKEGIIVISGL